MWTAFHGINGNESDFPTERIGYTFDFDENTLIEDYFKGLPQSSTDIPYQLPMVKGGEWIGCFSERLGIDIVLDNVNAVYDIEADLFPLNMKYATAGCGMLDEEEVRQAGASTEEQDYLLHRYKDNVQRFMDVAAFYGSHIECGNINVMTSVGYRPVSDVTQIYNLILNKFQTRYKTYLYIRENYGLSYGYHDAKNNRRMIYFGKSSGESEARPSPDDIYTTFGWNIYIRDILAESGTPVKYDCIISSYIDAKIDEKYRQVCVDVVATNTENTYPAVYDKRQTEKTEKTEIDNLPPVTVTLYPCYPKTVQRYHICSSFIIINGSLNIASVDTSSPKPTVFDYNYHCLWRADVKNPAENNTSQISIVSSKTSCMPEVPTMLQRTVFERHGDVGLRLYASVQQNNSELVGNATSPLEEKIIDIDANFTKEDYFQALFGNTDFSIYRGEVIENDSGSRLKSLCIVNTKCITERNKWYMLGITDDEYNQCVEALKGEKYCSKIYFVLNEVMDDDTVNSFYHKYELRILYDTPQSINNILPVDENKTVYVYTVDRHIFFSEKYDASSKFNVEASSNIAIHFRPCENYDKEYGIDWLRIVEYFTYDGPVYRDSIEGGRDMDENAEYAYKSLRNEYECLLTNTIYYIPYLRLFSKQYSDNHKVVYNNQSIQPPYKANIRLLIKDSQIQYPCLLKFDYDHTLFKISDLGDNDCMTLTDGTSKTVNIECLGAFACNQTISAWLQMPDGSKLVGALNVRANNHITYKDIHIFRIETKVDDASGKTEQGVVYDDEIVSLCKFCYQSYINPVLHIANISLVDDLRFKKNSQFINDTNQLRCSTRTEITEICNALNQLINAELTKNSIRNSIIYIFKLSGTFAEGEGFTQAIGSPYGIMINRITKDEIIKRQNHSMAHEFFHGLGLIHTSEPFANPPKYYFTKSFGKIMETNNLMSYEGEESVKYLWDWQILEITNKKK